MRTLIPLAALLLMIAAVVSCSAPANQPTEPIATPPPTHEAAKPAETLPPLEAFESDLLAALADPRDYPSLTKFMGDSWEVLIFRGNGEQYAPDDAVEQLRDYLLPPDNNFALDETANMTALLGEDPMEFYRGNAKGFLFTTGWGEDGQDEAILVINEDAASRYFWQGILYSPGGF